LCINKSAKARCVNKAKPQSDFCGIHKNCRDKVQGSPQRQRSPSPRKEQPVQRQRSPSPRKGQPKMLPHEIFAQISSFLPGRDGDITRVQAGNIEINQKQPGKQMKNGAFHSFDGEPSEILENGTRRWHKNGKLHRDGDEPAVITHDGIRKWFKNGKLHRDGDRPAYINNDRVQQYWKNGQPHRDGDRPAVIIRPRRGHHYVIQEWWKNGKRHSDGNRAAFIHGDYKEYWKDGVLHRDGDRAAIRDGKLSKWYKNGVLHRDNGLPAVHTDKHNGYNEWWINGQFIRREGREPFANSPQAKLQHENFTSAWAYRLREIQR
jgi:antitoxin component YwqK of YwqJK toxin-antitoxin module